MKKINTIKLNYNSYTTIVHTYVRTVVHTTMAILWCIYNYYNYHACVAKINNLLLIKIKIKFF